MHGVTDLVPGGAHTTSQRHVPFFFRKTGHVSIDATPPRLSALVSNLAAHKYLHRVPRSWAVRAEASAPPSLPGARLLPTGSRVRWRARERPRAGCSAARSPRCGLLTCGQGVPPALFAALRGDPRRRRRAHTRRACRARSGRAVWRRGAAQTQRRLATGPKGGHFCRPKARHGARVRICCATSLGWEAVVGPHVPSI